MTTLGRAATRPIATTTSPRPPSSAWPCCQADESRPVSQTVTRQPRLTGVASPLAGAAIGKREGVRLAAPASPRFARRESGADGTRRKGTQAFSEPLQSGSLSARISLGRASAGALMSCGPLCAVKEGVAGVGVERKNASRRMKGHGRSSRCYVGECRGLDIDPVGGTKLESLVGAQYRASHSILLEPQSPATLRNGLRRRDL